MSKKLPLSKKQLVVAGVTSAGLFLSPAVLADEASVPSTLTIPSTPSSQVSPTPDAGHAVETTSPLTSASADVNASTTSSESSEVVSSEAVSTSVSTSQAVPTVTAQASPAVSSSASASQVAHARVAVTSKESVAKVSAADLAKVDTSDIQGRTYLQVKGWQKPVSAPIVLEPWVRVGAWRLLISL